MVVENMSLVLDEMTPCISIEYVGFYYFVGDI